MTRTTGNSLRSLMLLMLAALVASVLMAVAIAAPAQAAPTLFVTTSADEQNTNGQCSLREAIVNANANDQSGSADCGAGGTTEDEIRFNLGSAATITLASQLPAITDSAGLTIAGGGAKITVSGNDAARVFAVGSPTISGAKLTLDDLTVANGRSILGGGILNESSNTLTVRDSTLSGNNANVGIASGGGGIWNNGGTVTVSNSTISGNSAYYSGGGIHNNSPGTLTVSNSTISGNGVTDVDYGKGGGISSNGGSVTLKNTIVANSPSGGSCYGTITNGGYNLDSDGSCGFGTTNHSISGAWDNPLDPLLGPLADNGGPTWTHALLAGSPAIDKGNSFGEIADQRGVSRPLGAASDIGAFERVNPAPPAISVVAGSASQSACLATNKGRVTLKLSDADSDANSLTLSATSSNRALVRNSNIIFDGTGATRTATITTVPGQTGSSDVRITVSDGQASKNVRVSVQAGGSTKDILSGTTGADLLLGQGGADTLDGLGSSDVLCGAGGNDILRAGSGPDTLDGGSGTDSAPDYSQAQGDARINIP